MSIEPKVAPKTNPSNPSKASKPTVAKPVSRVARTKRSTVVKRTPVNRTVKKATVSPHLVEKSVAKKEVDTNKTEKSGKVKMERDSFTMPRDEYAQLAVLKERLLVLGQPAKKSELLRAGIKQLVAMSDLRLKKAMTEVPVIKTGRPKKKKS